MLRHLRLHAARQQLTGSTSSSTASLAINDNTPPSITCPSNVVVSANFGCNATNVALGSPVTGDNCGRRQVTHDGMASDPLGTNLVTWTVTDSAETATVVCSG